jgi:hypothetical protein
VRPDHGNVPHEADAMHATSSIRCEKRPMPIDGAGWARSTEVCRVRHRVPFASRLKRVPDDRRSRTTAIGPGCTRLAPIVQGRARYEILTRYPLDGRVSIGRPCRSPFGRFPTRQRRAATSASREGWGTPPKHYSTMSRISAALLDKLVTFPPN